jgi:two-component system, NtrC family, response regulator AtoC
LEEKRIQVSFLSQDAGLGEALGRALGERFGLRTEGMEFDRAFEMPRSADVVLLDLRSANTQGSDEASLRLIGEMNRNASRLPVVVLCDAENRSLLLQAIELGAIDSIANPPNILELEIVLRRAYRLLAAEAELQRLRAATPPAGMLYELIGTSGPMQELFALARKIAPFDVNVLITGETGTGKELLARAIHQFSPRNRGSLVAFSCANLPETLVEDELFGHERGAFTGAQMSRRGRLEAADHGTLFLDEIGDLGVGLQPKLLRVIQERSFERLGTNKTTRVDIRLICATHRNLDEMVKEGKFREDLYYRLNVVQMHLPALRERRDDVSLLAQQFLQRSAEQFRKKAKRFSQQALHALEEYHWPGNVRELENVVQRAVALCEDHIVDILYLPASLRAGTESSTPACGDEARRLPRSYEEEIRRFKRGLVLRALRENGWRKTESARSLGVARGYLHRLIHQLGIQEPEDVSSSEQGRILDVRTGPVTAVPEHDRAEYR